MTRKAAPEGFDNHLIAVLKEGGKAVRLLSGERKPGEGSMTGQLKSSGRKIRQIHSKKKETAQKEEKDLPIKEEGQRKAGHPSELRLVTGKLGRTKSVKRKNVYWPLWEKGWPRLVNTQKPKSVRRKGNGVLAAKGLSSVERFGRVNRPLEEKV